MKKTGGLLIAIFLVLLFTLSLSLFSTRNGVAFASDQRPIAFFSYSPTSPLPHEAITFNATVSRDPDGTITKYTWNFGDGNVTVITTPTVTHVYPTDGNYTVQLTVTDDDLSTGQSSAVVQVSTVVFFRVVFYGSLVPMSDVEVTGYYNNGTAYVKAPVGPSELEIKYDNMTQPDLAGSAEERYRNPGFTASILRDNASNIGFDVHPSSWTVYFKFKWGPFEAFWPDNSSTVNCYDNGVVETYTYSPGDGPYWDPLASRYVIRVNDIPGGGVAPTVSHPIIIGSILPPPTQKYYLSVQTSPSGVATIPGEGLYNQNTNISLTAPATVDISSGLRYRFTYWDIDGTSQGIGTDPITVNMNTNHTATAHYAAQYSVIFDQTGLNSHATGTIATVNGTTKTFANMPYSFWVDSGSSITYSYAATVTSSVTGERFRLNTVTGPTSPITVSAATNVTGNYVTQYQVTFAQTGLDSSAAGTVVAVNGTARNYAGLPFNWWVDSGSTVTYAYAQPVSSSISGKRFRLSSISGSASPITVTAPTTVTGSYATQYAITFAQTGLDSTATGTVATINGSSEQYSNLPYVLWGDSGASVNYSYNDILLSSITGKRFKQTGITGPTSPLTISSAVTVTGNYKTQYYVTFDQSGVGADYLGTVVTIDGTAYSRGALPIAFWWDSTSNHTFSFTSPLSVPPSNQYTWSSTTGPSTLQSGTLAVSTSGNIVANYVVQNSVTFDVVGANSDFGGTILFVDGTPYLVTDLPMSFMWQIGSTHNFAFQSPLLVTAYSKQYVWTSTSGLSTSQSGSLNVTTFGDIIGNYKTQYYLSIPTNPPGLTTPTGIGWHDANSFASISTGQYLPAGSRWSFTGWTTGDMSEIADPSSPSTTVFVDQAKTLTADYVHQYEIIFYQSGAGSDFTGTVVTVDGIQYNVGALPLTFWYDINSTHSFSYASPLIVNASRQYNWLSTSGLSNLQNGTMTIDADGTVTGNYAPENKLQIIFAQSGLSSDFSGTVLIIDGYPYTLSGLPASFWWDTGSSHTFNYQSPLIVSPNSKRYIWVNTTGLSTLQSGTINVTSSGTITGNYLIQYYLALETNPNGLTSPSGSGWYNVGTSPSISTLAFIDIVTDSSRYRFNGWSTADMGEISDPMVSPTSVLMDKAKTVTAHYVIQYKIVFNQTGVSTDFIGTVATIDGIEYSGMDLPITFWWDSTSVHTFSYGSPLIVLPVTKQYAWTWTTGMSTLQDDSLTISASGSISSNYKTQYYLTVTSPHDSPTPASGWLDSGTSVIASVTSPTSGPAGTRYVSTGWTGTGSVPTSGSGTSTSFTLNQASSITWTWKTQYYLTVTVSPTGLVTIPGEAWYDASSNPGLNAPSITGYTFLNWTVDGASQGAGVNPINVLMNAPHTATANYRQITVFPLAVSITPDVATIYIGQSVNFTSTVTGGTLPYTCQWYINNFTVPGGTSSNWLFTPSATGTYYIYIRVTDAHNVTVQSSTSRVTVLSITVGGYTVEFIGQDLAPSFAAYASLLAAFIVGISIFKRKKK